MAERVVFIEPHEVVAVPTVTDGKRERATLESLYNKAVTIQRQCSDFTVPEVSLQTVRFVPETGVLSFVPEENNRSALSSHMTHHSMGQLCTKLGVPMRYVEKCISSGNPDLAADNINYWIDEYGKSLFIRTYEDKVRGVLSDRFMVLDTPDLIAPLIDVTDSSQYTVKGSFLSEERFHARIVHNDMLDVEGEDLFLGIQIDSSDVGRSVISVRILLYKQVCTNGLCISKANFDLFKKRHLGSNSTDLSESFRSAYSRVPELMEDAEQLVRTSFQSDSLPFSLLNADDRVFLSKYLREQGISVKEIEDVASMLDEQRYSDTRWGLVNTLTDVAKRYSLDRRLFVESAAGEILLAK